MSAALLQTLQADWRMLRTRLATHAGTVAEVLLNTAATLQAVWFYLANVRCYLKLDQFEHGTAHTPYQYRLLLMLPLRWAHGSALCGRIAGTLTAMPAWFPHGVRPESLVQFPLDAAAVAVTGLVARRLYRAASPTGLLTAAVYPLTLLMVVGTYALGTMYRLRFVYDLPSLGFFAMGMALVYFCRPRWQFVLLFAVATVNRETTLFLLPMFGLARWAQVAAAEPGQQRRRWLPLPVRDVALICGLLAAWIGWHGWVAHRFSANGTESWDRLPLNLKMMLLPASWLQLMSCFAFCGPLVLLWRRRILDRVLRLWLWVVPLWAMFMLHFGLLLESRIFGELIPLVACCVTLGAESVLCAQLPLLAAAQKASEGEVHLTDGAIAAV